MKFSHYTSALTLTLTVLTIGVIYFLYARWAPLLGDDLLFVADYIRVNPGGETLSWQGFRANLDYLYHTDNVRLPNLVLPFVLIGLSKTGQAILVAGLVTALILAVSKLVSNHLYTATVAAAWALVAIFCPWRGATITTDIAMNVFPPAVFNLLFLITLSAPMSTLPSRIAMAASALAACTMHEGWSVPIFAGLSVLVFYRKFKVPAEVWVSLTIYASGCVWLMTAPGMMQRTQNVGATSFDAKLFVTIAMPVVMAFCALGYAAFRRDLRHFLMGNATFLTLTVAWCASIAINIYNRSLNTNAVWISDIMSIVIVLAVAKKVVGDLAEGKESKGIKRAATVLAFAMPVAFYANVLRVQHSIYEQNSRIETALEASASGTVFADVDIRVPHSTLLHPVNDIWWNWLHIYSANELEKSLGGERLIAVVPAALAQFDTAAMRAVPGTAGVFDYRGILLAHDRPLAYSHWTGPLDTPALPVQLTLTDADGEVYEDFDCLAERFTTTDGLRMLWIRPLHADVDGPFIEVSGSF